MSEQRIVDAHLVQNLVGRLLQDLRARVEVLVDAMAEAHQAEVESFVLGQIDVFLVVAAVGLDHLQHLDDCLVGAAVQRSPQRADPRRERGEQIGLAAADQPYGGRAAVLLVVGVQDQAAD